MKNRTSYGGEDWSRAARIWAHGIVVIEQYAR